MPTETSGRQRSTQARTALAVAMTAMALASPALAADAASPPILSPARQLSVARAFAPTLLFHPREEFLPTDSRGLSDGETPIEAWSSRNDQYRALTMPEKLARAALAYRVFSRVHDRQLEVIVEYWCYYVYNAFTVRGGWLPFRMPDNHPNDLERLYLVLEPTASAWQTDGLDDEQWARDSFKIRRIVANAHDGSIPPNQYRVRDGESIEMPVTVIVERGSHAMAPDINHDGRFTLGIDSTEVFKMQWGIRDSGSTWRWYRESFMDGRDASSVRLCGPVSDSAPDSEVCPRYSLHPVDGLQRWFQDLQLSEGDRHRVVGSTPWLVRAFGDVKAAEKLMVPADPANGRMLDRMLRRRSDSERGFVAGFTTVDYAPALVVGRRAFWEIPAHRAPDVLAEAVLLFPNDRRTLVEATVWGSYRLDAITNFLIGVGWFSEADSASVAAGAEVRLGRFRIRPSWRLRDGGFDSRVTTTF